MTTELDDLVAWRTTIPTPSGRCLAALVCEPVDMPARGLVVVPPGYERRIHHYGVPSRHLIRAGYATLRFDHSNHVGLSDGDVYDLTMSSMTEDIVAALDAASGVVPGVPLSVAAPSLSARAAVRAVSGGGAALTGVERVVLLLPVVDVRRTVATVAGADVFEMRRRGEIEDHVVSEHVVSGRFADDAVEHGFDTLTGTQHELSTITTPVTAVTAETDDWVVLDDVLTAMDHPADAERRMVVIEGSSHAISQNPPALRTFLEALVAGVGDDADAPPHMSFEEIVDTVQAERAWAADGYESFEPRQEVPR